MGTNTTEPITGPIATESAPVGLISSAIGIVVAAGEIFGGGIAPAIAGGRLSWGRGFLIDERNRSGKD